MIIFDYFLSPLTFISKNKKSRTKKSGDSMETYTDVSSYICVIQQAVSHIAILGLVAGSSVLDVSQLAS
jgi:hypothetical protein